MDKEHYLAFYKEFSYPEESVLSLQSGYDAFRTAGIEARFDELVARYEKDMYTDHTQLRADMRILSDSAGVNVCQGDLLLMIALSKPLKGYYEKAGISLDVWHSSMLDLRCKLLECKQLYGVWGVAVGDWFGWFYQCKRFGLGRLQFEIAPLKSFYDFEGEMDIDGIPLTRETSVLNIHIPNTGTPLDRDCAHDAYRRAKAFYKRFHREIFQGDKVVFCCRSWLLFQRHKEILKRESNLIRFMEDFTILCEGEYPDYALTWRIFNTTKLEDIDALPQSTSLQRGYVNWMKKGEKTGWATGVFTI